jgi:alcohol dehydrogenase
LLLRAFCDDQSCELHVIATLADPSPTPSCVVLEVEATGLCRSDWHGWIVHDSPIRLRHVPGHELAGTVIAFGRDVRNWRGCDGVTVCFVVGCDHCHECEGANQRVCENQFQPGLMAWGSFANYVAHEDADVNLVRVPNEMSSEVAASVGHRFVTAFRSVVNQGRCRPGNGWQCMGVASWDHRPS